MKKIILFAANGFIGRAIIDHVSEYQKDYEVVAVSRKPISGLPFHTKQVIWDGKTRGDWTQELEGADLIINLAGRSVNCRYTEKNKAAIFASRLDSTRIIGEAIQDCKQKPACWINCASATIYEHPLEKPTQSKTGKSERVFQSMSAELGRRPFLHSKTFQSGKSCFVQPSF